MIFKEDHILVKCNDFRSVERVRRASDPTKRVSPPLLLSRCHYQVKSGSKPVWVFCPRTDVYEQVTEKSLRHRGGTPLRTFVRLLFLRKILLDVCFHSHTHPSSVPPFLRKSRVLLNWEGEVIRYISKRFEP